MGEGFRRPRTIALGVLSLGVLLVWGVWLLMRAQEDPLLDPMATTIVLEGSPAAIDPPAGEPLAPPPEPEEAAPVQRIEGPGGTVIEYSEGVVIEGVILETEQGLLIVPAEEAAP